MFLYHRALALEPQDYRRKPLAEKVSQTKDSIEETRKESKMAITGPGPFKGLDENPWYRQYREISFVERYFFWRTQLKYYSNYRILVEYNEELTPEKIYHALTRMLYKYSALTMDLMPSKKNDLGYRFVLVDEVKLGDVVEFIDDDRFASVQEILNSYHEVGFSYGTNKPLWRLKVIQKKYILFFCDHILYDGTSGKNFHIELSKEIANGIPKIISGSFKGLESIIFSKSMVDFSTYQIQPAPVHLFDYNRPYGVMLFKLLIVLLPVKLSNIVRYWFSGSPYYNILAYNELDYKSLRHHPGKSSSCRIISLDSFQLNSLLKVARLHNVKLTSLLLVLANMSFGRFVASSGKDTLNSIPVNIRRIIDMEAGHRLCKNFSTLFGLYVGDIRIRLPCINKLCPDDQLNWSLVSYVNKTIHDEVPNSHIILGFLRFVNVKSFIVEEYKKETKSSFEISNLGQIAATHKNIIGAWFDQPPGLFSVNAISTESGVNLVLRCCNEEWIDEYRNELERHLFSIIPEDL